MIAALFLIAIKSMMVAAVTLGFLRLAALRSSAERSIIAHLGLFALLTLPLAHFFLPALSIFIPKHVLGVLQAPMSVIATQILARVPTASLSAPVDPAAAGASLAHWSSTLVLCAYLLPAITLVLFICAALLRLFSLRKHARPVVDPVWLSALTRAQRRMGFTKSTALFSGGDIASPISWGLITPTILLNEDVLAASEQAEVIIAHELAHLIQHDWTKLIFGRIATAAFWFNPLIWLLVREAHQLREEAADDAVLAADFSAPDYATLLIGVARCELRGLLSVVHGVAPSRSSLRRRITRVLDDGSVRAMPGRCQVAVWTTVMLVMAAPLAALNLSVARRPQPQVGLSEFPQMLRKALDDECVSNGGTPGQSPNLFRKVDLNGDGIPDLVFDRNNYECRGAAMGSGAYGTMLTIFIGGPANSVAEVYTGAFYGSRVESGADGKQSLIVADAADCDMESCGHRVVLDARTHRFRSRKEPDPAPN
jgi:beta-lactamase regulating signal transducer with metallopeptidase domain